MIHRGHRIQLNPNNAQATYFAKACGISRLAYNWGLSRWKELYEGGEKPSGRGIKKDFNAVKHIEFPFVTEVTKCAPETAFDNLNKAFKNFFRNLKAGRKPGYPQFKKKGVHDSFTIDNSKFVVDHARIRVPKLGWVRMTEELRFEGKILSATISRAADKWFVSISVEIPNEDRSENQTLSPVGIDLGLSKLATLSDGVVFENVRTTRRFERRIRRLNKSLVRKKIGSNHWKKAKIQLGRLHYRVRCIRNDAIHKMTRFIADKYSTVCLEDLNVSRMIRNRWIAKHISDAASREIRRQLEYKSVATSVVEWIGSFRVQSYAWTAVNCMSCPFLSGYLNAVRVRLTETCTRHRIYYGRVCRKLSAWRQRLWPVEVHWRNYCL